MLGLRRHQSRLLVLSVVILVAGACSEDAQTQGESVSSTVAEADYVGSISLEPDRGPAGTEVRLTGEDLPASEQLELRWSTAQGSWLLEGERNEEYHGREYELGTETLATVATDSSGHLDATFEVPAGYGFGHDVTLMDTDGVVRNKALFTVEMQVTVTPKEGPVGTPITVDVVGMGWQTLENTRQLLYDDSYVGFLSSVTTTGHARVVIPAVGSSGPHSIRVMRGAYTFSYLNPLQSPRPDIPVFDDVFTVTEGDPVLPSPIEDQNPGSIESTEAPSSTEGAVITTNLSSAPVDTQFELMGEGFESGATIDLLWYRVVGNRVSGSGWEEQSVTLGQANASEDGSFSVPLQVPHDVGGAHRIEAVVDGDSVSSTEMDVTPAASPLSPESGPWGTKLSIQLTGVGWTETANIYTFVYDNSYIGYACGFNSQGDVEVTIPATGEPGWHFIDLYPAIYKGQETRGQQHFRIPQLTYANDHPGESLPAFHFSFYLEG